MKKIALSWLLAAVISLGLNAQTSFTPKTSLLNPVNHYSGVAIAIMDMNGDGLDDIARLSLGTSLNIQYQNAANQPFTSSAMNPLPGTDDTWGMCTADVDNDGLGDVLAGGFYNGIKIVRPKPGGIFEIENLTTPETFVQGVNFADINNDGWLDAFVCHDDGAARIYGNNGDGTFTYQPGWINLNTVPSSDNSGNYGSVWSDVDNDGDLDLYIAHCRQGVNNASDPRRINQLFLNNGDYTFTQDVANVSGLRIGAQSWTADFGDIDNDGDFDCFITNHDVNSQLLENDGSGHFTDITASAGFIGAIQGLPLQGVFRDFDNDGFVDILVAGYQHLLFHNNGDKTFSPVSNLFDAHQIESFAIGDLNHDGFPDIYAGYALVYTDPSSIPDVLWMNDGNSNHFWGINLIGQQSNRSGVGAKIRVYSALGIQTREVRSGESYGISNSLQIQFGLGQITQIDSVVVNWPSGVRDVLYQPAVDQYITLYEGGCQSPAVSLVSAGPTVICSGQSVTIGTDVNFQSYQWNTGDTTATILATQAGNYFVTVTNGQGCSAVSNPISVIVDPIEIPSISVTGDTVFCSGGEAILTCSPAQSYLWNTGETTQSISATQTGNYTVAAHGLCTTSTSSPVSIQTISANLPVAIPDTILPGALATLVAQGENIIWYDSPTTTTSLAENDTLITQALTQNTTFWVSNTYSTIQPNAFVGMVDHQGSPFSDNSTNGGLIFDCYKPFILSKTKVIAALEGDRKIDLKNSAGDVIQTKTVNVPVGTTDIELGFEVPVGTDFVLTTDATANQATLGTISPQLRRSNTGCAFPYEIPGVVSIKTSTFNETRYYYFYNWEISLPGLECESERIPVEVVVKTNSSTQTPEWAQRLRLYPNPANDVVNIDLQSVTGGEVRIELQNAQGKTLQSSIRNIPAGNAGLQQSIGQNPAGIYWIKISGNDGTAQFKIAKE